MFKTSRAAYAVALACGLLAQNSQAALTETGVSCDGQNTSMTAQPGYLSCAGSFSGNNLNQAGAVESEISAAFGLAGLTTVTDISGSNTGSSGILTFATESTPFVVSLKAGNAFSLYEFAAGTSSINFDTLGVGFFSGNGENLQEHYGQGLSHAALYAVTAAVPEPETYALMLAGLAALGLVRKRGRKSPTRL